MQFEKITMTNPVVEIDGDEMTRVLWAEIKKRLLEPFVDLKCEYYDLSLTHRDETDDQVTVDAANAIKRHKVGVKCATITPNFQRMEEYKLKKMWRSPNGTIRSILDGTVFRTPIPCEGLDICVPRWVKPITVARHSYGDIYKDTEIRVECPGTAELVFRPSNGEEIRKTIYDFEGPGVLQGCYNKDSSIESFARSCFEFALSEKRDLWFSTKDTIMKQYDGLFKTIFEKLYEKEYAEKFAAAGITYFYTLIDDAVARIMKSSGGMVWALKNYDGDVMSDMISSSFGSLAMMTSVLVTADGCFEYEAAHGTVTRHYYKWLKGEKTSTNPVATIYAWSGALRKRGEIDNLPRLVDFADVLENSVMDTIKSGVMTGDLAAMMQGVKGVESTVFLDAIKANMEKMLCKN
jgi:isocitrate dehydrogenase